MVPTVQLKFFREDEKEKRLNAYGNQVPRKGNEPKTFFVRRDRSKVEKLTTGTWPITVAKSVSGARNSRDVSERLISS